MPRGYGGGNDSYTRDKTLGKSMGGLNYGEESQRGGVRSNNSYAASNYRTGSRNTGYEPSDSGRGQTGGLWDRIKSWAWNSTGGDLDKYSNPGRGNLGSGASRYNQLKESERE